jgi:hypothetical protein
MRFGAAGKRIARELALAGLRRLHGPADSEYASGEQQKMLDVVANDILLETFDYGGLVSMAASEELDEVRAYGSTEGHYAVLFDPMDGSSNIDVNGTLGTIFSIRRRAGNGPEGLLRPGTEQVAAGYILFGPAVLLVYTAGARSRERTPLLDAVLGLARRGLPPDPSRRRHLLLSARSLPGRQAFRQAAPPVRMPSARARRRDRGRLRLDGHGADSRGGPGGSPRAHPARDRERGRSRAVRAVQPGRRTAAGVNPGGPGPS